MKNLNKAILIGSLILSAFGASVSKTYAQSYSTSSEKFNITIDKKIRPISDVKYYDNIPSKQKTFVEKDQIDFQLTIENSGNTNLTNLTVKDTLPKYFIPSLFPGNYDKNTGLIQVSVESLNVGETKVFNIRGVVGNLPASDFSNQLVKLTNKAEVFNTKAYDVDYATYFAEKRVNPVTGSETIILGTVLTVVSVGIAFALRRQARGY
jgi:uncharacterized repeat protein (TIGR01451 family)